MGIRLDPSNPDKDWLNPIKEAAKAIYNTFVSQDYLAAGEAASTLFGELRNKSKDDPSKFAWTLWVESITIALADFTRSPPFNQSLDLVLFENLVSRLVERSRKKSESGEILLLKTHLVNPAEFELYRFVRNEITKNLRKIAPDLGLNDRDLTSRLDLAFARRFQESWIRNYTDSVDLVDAMVGPIGEALERRADWNRYYEFLHQDVSVRPVFGQANGGPTLEAVYVPLRCYWRKEPPRTLDEEADPQLPTEVYVAWLDQIIIDWLLADDPTDALKVVTGGPGSGKSSFARIFARNQAISGDYDVFVFQLQGIDITRNIEAIIDEYCKRTNFSTDSNKNPILRPKDNAKPLLLVFDGLDEVATPEAEGIDVAKEFITHLSTWLSQMHSTASKSRVKAIVLGRQAAAEHAAKENRFEANSIYHIAPLCPLEGEKHFERGHDTALVIHDEDRISGEDQRGAFWNRWATANSERTLEPPKALFSTALSDLSVEPLLLYLLIYSGFMNDESWKEAADNRNRIYQRIFEQIHEREIKLKRRSTDEILSELKDFFTMMECLALAAWRGGGRTGTEADFSQLRDKIYLPEQAHRFSSVRSASLNSVAMQIHAHRSHRDEPGYSFIHKSFGEYFCARALINAGDKWMCQENSRPDQAAQDWIRLSGQQSISKDIIQFMRDEARLRVAPSITKLKDYDQAQRRSQQIYRVILWARDHGLPAHLDIFASTTDPSWNTRVLAHKNSEEALHALFQAWARLPASDLPGVISVVALTVIAGSGGPQKATITLSIGEGHSTREATGDGPIDAVFKAINATVNQSPKLELYHVGAVTAGTDAQAEISVRLSQDGTSASGHAVDTDTMMASAKAYVAALNKLALYSDGID